jgi:membrane complex biogenesis BtpA family protein
MRLFDNKINKKLVIGLVHIKPLPGTPFFEKGNYELSMEKALRDVNALVKGGADGCLIQTVDRVYPIDTVDYARLAAFSTIIYEVSKTIPNEFKIGLQIMFNALKASVAVAKVCGGSFIRCAALVGVTSTGSGLVTADPEDFQKYRTYIQAQDIELVAEIDGTHFHWEGGRPTGEVARLAAYAGAHAVEVADPDEEACLRKISDVRKSAPGLPIIIGSGTNHQNAARLLSHADGAFVGTCLEKEGWGSFIDESRVRQYVDIVNSI